MYSSRNYDNFYHAIFITVSKLQRKRNLITYHHFRRIMTNEKTRKKYFNKFYLTLNQKYKIKTTDNEQKIWLLMSEYLMKNYRARLIINDALNSANCFFQTKCHNTNEFDEIHLVFNGIDKSYKVLLAPYKIRKLRKSKQKNDFCKYCGFLLSEHSFNEQFRFSKYCISCHGHFKNKFCFSHHNLKNEGNLSFCETFFYCGCGVKLKNKKDHVCSLKTTCYQCKEVYDLTKMNTPHLCYIKPHEKKNFKKIIKVCFFDIETYQNSDSLHIPNLICGRIYSIFSSSPENYEFSYSFNFFGENCIKEFFNLILKDENNFDNSIFISHLGSKYDMLFIASFAVYELKLKPKIVCSGNQILRLTLPKQRKFIDSYLFLLSPLRKLPKMFDLDKNLQKGYFPFLFNNPEFYDYKGPVPNKMYYGYEKMSAVDKEDFLLWYKQQNDIFDFKKELIRYCQMDCMVLAEAFLKFRDLVLITSGLDIFLENCFTLSGLTMTIFRNNYLPPELLLNIARDRKTYKSSKIATAFIDYINSVRKKKNLPPFLHHRNFLFGEVSIGSFLVDGYIPETKSILEIDNCFYHGYECCTKHKNETRLSRTERKHMFLKKWGFNLHVVKTCEIPIDFQKQVYNSLDIPEMTPSLGLFGGRSEVFCRFLQSNSTTNLNYYDIISLYPYVLRSKAFPVGEVQIIRPIIEKQYQFNLNKIFGLVYCKILAPKKLFVPVLPFRVRKKTIFGLCRLCSEQNIQPTKTFNIQQGEDLPENLTFCFHNSNERSFTGVYTSMELKVAESFGYKILQVFEIWNFENSSTELFSDFINTFFKYKLEASGFPPHVTSPEEKKRYIQKIRDTDNIELNPEKITTNNGLRTLSKSILVSLWGKFCMRQYLMTSYENDKKISYLLNSGNYKVHNIFPISIDCSLVTYEKLKNNVKNYSYSSTVNIIIAIFTTSYARLELLKGLQLVKPTLLASTDTDSICFGFQEELPIITGETLGCFSDEIAKTFGNSATLTEVVSPGAKQGSRRIYLPETNTFHYQIVCRGFSRTSEFQDKITHQLMKDAVFEKQVDDVVLNYTKFIKDKETLSIHTVPNNKKYHAVQDKRMNLKGSVITLPFGF